MVESTGATHSAAAAAFTPAVWAGACLLCADVALAAAGWHPTMALEVEHDPEIRQILQLLLQQQQLPFSQVFFSFAETFFFNILSGCLVISAIEME
jgi:hypothetical protein